MPKPRLAAIVGPTAVGKTAIAVALGARAPIEAISADSMQVYRGLDAGTAKPRAEERRAVPHHLIDVVEPEEKFDLARFLAGAAAAVEDIKRRGRIPLVVGGTGLYLRALGEGIFTEPSRDPRVRAELDARAKAEGAPALHAELAAADPESAGQISPNDAIRIVRALEVYKVTGKAMSHWRSHPEAKQSPSFDLRVAVLTRERDALAQRIGERAATMLGADWIAEVEGLLGRGLTPESHCFKALGYREVARLVMGDREREGLEEDIARETRQFAKRQMTWFRSMRVDRWIDLDREKPAAAIAALEKLTQF